MRRGRPSRAVALLLPPYRSFGSLPMDASAKKLYSLAMVSERMPETAGPPPGVLVSGHFDERPGYRAYRSHGRADWLVKYTLAGQGLYRQPDLSVLVGPGDLTLLAPGA